MATAKKVNPRAPIKDPAKKKASKPMTNDRAAENAKKAFTNFTLGKSASEKSSRNYVEKGQTVQDRQKEVISRQLNDLKPSGQGLTILVSNPELLKLEDGKMELSDLINGMEKAKNGYAFYTDGGSVTNQINISRRAEEIIENIKKGGTKIG